MCKYCSHLKELRAEDKKLYEMRKKLMDKAFLRKERLLERVFDLFNLILITDVGRFESDYVSSVSIFALYQDIQKELERQVI